MSQIIDPTFINLLNQAFRAGDSCVADKRLEADNVSRVAAVYHAIAAGDFAGLIDLLADNMELEILGPPTVPMVGRWVGRQQAVEAMRNNFALVEDQQPEIQSVVAQGDTVVILGRERGRYRATGKPYEGHWMHLFTFENGQVLRIRELFDSAALLAAAQA